MPIYLSEIIELCQVEAIANALSPTILSRWHKYCRDYAKLFHTPYEQVLQMDPEFVILAVTEEGLDKEDAIDKIDELMDRVYTIENPDYEEKKEEEIKGFIERALEREKVRKAKQAKKDAPKEEPLKELPKSGYVNLQYLANQDKEE